MFFFQAALSGDVTSNSVNNIKDEDDTSDYNDVQDNKSSPNFNELIGMKCRVPFSHDWGGMSYHNAIISGIDVSDSVDIPMVCK